MQLSVLFKLLFAEGAVGIAVVRTAGITVVIAFATDAFRLCHRVAVVKLPFALGFAL